MFSKPNRTRRDDGQAFLPDPLANGRTGRPHEQEARDTLAEMVGEGFLRSATSGAELFDEKRNEASAEEAFGPLVEVDGSEEFADGTDESNPEDGEREAFPTTLGGSRSR